MQKTKQDIADLVVEFLMPENDVFYNNGYGELSAFVGQYIWGITSGQALSFRNSGTPVYHAVLKEAIATARDIDHTTAGDFIDAARGWLQGPIRPLFLDWCEVNGKGVDDECLKELGI